MLWIPALMLSGIVAAGAQAPYELTAEQRRIPLETPLEAKPGTAKIVLLAGLPSNKPGQHEYFAGCALMKECLAQSPGVTPVLVAGGWPMAGREEAVFAGAKSIVCYLDGGAKLAMLPAERWERLRGLMKSGVGLVMLHQAVEVPADRASEFQSWLGGVWQPDQGGRGHWDMGFGAFPSAHETLRGVKPFAAPKDGWLYNLHFAPSGVTPILSGLIPDKARTTADAKAHRGRAEVVAWAFERSGGGRSFAFTGCDLHSNWALESQRRLVINGILWSAGLPVPEGGAPVTYDLAKLPENWDRKLFAK
jgi:type 1 glutamine amidotransferase